MYESEKRFRAVAKLLRRILDAMPVTEGNGFRRESLAEAIRLTDELIRASAQDADRADIEQLKCRLLMHAAQGGALGDSGEKGSTT